MKKIALIIILFSSAITFAQRRTDVKKEIPLGQEIEVRENNYFINGEQVPTYEVKEYLKNSNSEAYQLFKKGKNKGAWGGFLLGSGGVLIVSDAVKALVSDVSYPSAMSYVGAGLAIISWPVLSGKKQLVSNGIEKYNSSLKTTGEIPSFDYNLTVIGNQNGIGLQVTF